MMTRSQAIIGALAIAVAAGAAKPADAENVLRWASATEALTFDPHSANNFPTIAANLQVYEPLVDFNSSSEIEPALAVAWRLTDPTTWQFDLRQDVRFHDGTPFTSEDVIFSLTRGTSSTSDFRTAVSPIAAVEAVDDHTVRIRTATPNPILPEQLNSVPMMSKRWAEQHDAVLPTVYGEDIDYAERHANGTGPFKLVSFEPGVGTVMLKNPEWWGFGQNPHNLDRIVHTVMKDPARRLAALLNGEIDFVSDPPLADLDQIERTPGLKLERTNETRTIFLGLDQGSQQLRSSDIKGRNPFADLRVRRAIYQAIDVETIRNEVMSGLAIPIGMIVQPGINGYAPELDTRFPFDPDVAKALLAEAGYPDGFAVTLDCPNDRYVNDEAICRAVAAMLGEISIRVSVAARPMREHQPMLRDKETDFYMLGFGTTTYDSLYILSYVVRSDAPYNAANYVNSKVDGLIDYISTAMVTYARDAMIEEVWRTVRDDIVLVPLHQQVIVWAMSDELDLPVDPWNLPRFRLARLND
ncbi:MAG TPA: ABC transporter substrate-binding protein [Geminicoccaceae bacterium]|nr:ABC transporter substrate-binding protein [Geminicoccaceae bacterium]